MGWRAWIWGYKIVLVPNSVVYHTGGQTVKDQFSTVRFHGVKNSLIIRLANFETSLAASSIIKSFGIVLLRKTFGISVVKDPEQTLPLPYIGILFHSVGWILKNIKYIMNKRNKINSRRVRSSKDLLRLGLITKLNH